MGLYLVRMEQPGLSDFTLLFAFGTTGMLILAGSIVFFVLYYKKRMLESRIKVQELEVAHQQKMLQATLESQENERKRLAADLHDSIGAMLSTIRLSLSTSVTKSGENSEQIGQIKNMLDDTIDSVRRLSRDLLPSTLEKFGLSYAIREMCEQYSTVSGLPIQFHEKEKTVSIEKSSEVMIFRIIQELINNAMKHASATQIQVVLNWSNTLRISVTDDGIGFVPETTKSGLGLFNMQNRAKLVGGVLNFEKDISKGTNATLTIPL